MSTHPGKRKKALKECLLDRHVIAGIGSIYADEILFTAGIHPARPANALTKEEGTRPARIIPERMAFCIEMNKTAPAEYLAAKGQHYRSTPFLQAYGQGNAPGRRRPRAGLPPPVGLGRPLVRLGPQWPNMYCTPHNCLPRALSGGVASPAKIC